jgi:predicted kinase
MPTVHLICGYLGAGKTSLARRLERELPAVRFTHDEWMVRLCGRDPPVEKFEECFQRVSAIIDSRWPKYLRLGVDVVLDLNFWTRQQRNMVRDLTAELGAASRLYYLHCSDEVAWERIERRNADEKGSLYIARNTFEVLKSRFEPLGPDEVHIAIAT